MKKHTMIENKIDTLELSQAVARSLVSEGSFTIPMLGTFRVVNIKNLKRYDFDSKKLIKQTAFRKIQFTASEDLKRMLNPQVKKKKVK